MDFSPQEVLLCLCLNTTILLFLTWNSEVKDRSIEPSPVGGWDFPSSKYNGLQHKSQSIINLS